ncbi:hypothetical protein HH214_14485 [Mucilaginibacter robiniae]|uniref:Peptidoglycan-binding protein LysM n=1 Tax=Mucilaginibacter robiniae TaxID=2728022 RepID=A0A7L5E0U1_9SPHI|nr:hypothetical protein [Mucilaginibacter robiniae]QJD96990.1 hypothetical protein HH214_14485 [Mucilaginibacter robiniae]
MKKFLLTTTLTVSLMALFSAAKAQTTSTATSNLNVHISEQIKIDFGDGSGNVGGGDINLYFNTPDDYVNGVSATKNGHLVITSTGNYTVDVKTQDAALKGLTGTNSNTIDASAIKVQLLSTSGSGIAGNTTGLNLSQTDSRFITSAPATTKTALDVKYFTEPNDARFVGVTPDTYTTKITYTLTAN